MPQVLTVHLRERSVFTVLLGGQSLTGDGCLDIWIESLWTFVMSDHFLLRLMISLRRIRLWHCRCWSGSFSLFAFAAFHWGGRFHPATNFRGSASRIVRSEWRLTSWRRRTRVGQRAPRLRSAWCACDRNIQENPPRPRS